MAAERTMAVATRLWGTRIRRGVGDERNGAEVIFFPARG